MVECNSVFGLCSHTTYVAATCLTVLCCPWQHLHGDKNCQSEETRSKHGEMECIAASMVKHVAKKHGFSEDDINEKMNKYGMTLAGMMTAHLKHAAKTGRAEASSERVRSNERHADEASKARRAEASRRRMTPTTPPRRPGPRASWVAGSTVDGRRRQLQLQTEEQQHRQLTVRVGVEPAGKTHLHHKKVEDALTNHSMHAKKIMRAANLGAANMGTKPPSVGQLAGAAWDAAVSTDSSLFGRMRSIFGGVQLAVEKSTAFMTEFRERTADTARAQWAGRRQLHAHEHSAYDEIDRALGTRAVGWEAPQEHLDNWAWIAEALDWSSAFDEARRVTEILHERAEAVYIHAAETGTLPAGDLKPHHKTGHRLLDINAPPTRIGEALRGLQWHTSTARRRRLGEESDRGDHGRALSAMPRAGTPGKSVISSVLDAALDGDDVLDAAIHALHHNEHRSWTRRLAEGFLGGASYSLPVVSGKSTVSALTKGGNATTEFARYVVYDLVLWLTLPLELTPCESPFSAYASVAQLSLPAVFLQGWRTVWRRHAGRQALQRPNVFPQW